MATSLFAFAVYAVTRFPTAFSNAKSPVDGVRLYLTELNKRLNPDEEGILNILPHHEEVIVDDDSSESATPEPENLGVDVPDDDGTVAGDTDQTLLDVIQDVVNNTTTTPNMAINIAELFDEEYNSGLIEAYEDDDEDTVGDSFEDGPKEKSSSSNTDVQGSDDSRPSSCTRTLKRGRDSDDSDEDDDAYPLSDTQNDDVRPAKRHCGDSVNTPEELSKVNHADAPCDVMDVDDLNRLTSRHELGSVRLSQDDLDNAPIPQGTPIRPESSL